MASNEDSAYPECTYVEGLRGDIRYSSIGDGDFTLDHWYVPPPERPGQPSPPRQQDMSP